MRNQKGFYHQVNELLKLNQFASEQKSHLTSRATPNQNRSTPPIIVAGTPFATLFPVRQKSWMGIGHAKPVTPALATSSQPFGSGPPTSSVRPPSSNGPEGPLYFQPQGYTASTDSTTSDGDEASSIDNSGKGFSYRIKLEVDDGLYAQGYRICQFVLISTTYVACDGSRYNYVRSIYEMFGSKETTDQQKATNIGEAGLNDIYRKNHDGLDYITHYRFNFFFLAKTSRPQPVPDGWTIYVDNAPVKRKHEARYPSRIPNTVTKIEDTPPNPGFGEVSGGVGDLIDEDSVIEDSFIHYTLAYWADYDCHGGSKFLWADVDVWGDLDWNAETP